MQANTETYHVYFDTDSSIVVMEWDGYATSQQFKEGTELMLNTLIKHQSVKVLADIKDMVLIGMEDQQWLDTQFIPRAIKFGFKAIAIIKPDNYFNRVAVETLITSAHSSRVKMLVVASGPSGLGAWQAVRRDIAADYRRAFGAEPGPVLGLGVMTDTDNTGAKAAGEYADLRFECAGS